VLKSSGFAITTTKLNPILKCTAVDVAIRDLRDVEAHWGTTLGLERLLECRAMLRHCLHFCERNGECDGPPMAEKIPDQLVVPDWLSDHSLSD
jgi:hypothetical protein